MKKNWTKEQVKGSFTVEATLIVPLILFVFATLIHILFYYHDKNILMAVAHETVVVGCGRQEQNEKELDMYFRSRTRDKLLLFTWVKSDILIEEKQISLTCKAGGKTMSLEVECAMSKTEPETYIRNIRKIKKIGEGIGE